MTQKITEDNIDAESLTRMGYNANSYPAVKLYSIYSVDSLEANLTPNQVSTTGGYLKLLGDNFLSPMQVYIDNTISTLVNTLDVNTIIAVAPAKPAGNYTLFVIRSDSSFASKFQSVTYA